MTRDKSEKKGQKRKFASTMADRQTTEEIEEDSNDDGNSDNTGNLPASRAQLAQLNGQQDVRMPRIEIRASPDHVPNHPNRPLRISAAFAHNNTAPLTLDANRQAQLIPIAANNNPPVHAQVYLPAPHETRHSPGVPNPQFGDPGHADIENLQMEQDYEMDENEAEKDNLEQEDKQSDLVQVENEEENKEEGGDQENRGSNQDVKVKTNKALTKLQMRKELLAGHRLQNEFPHNVTSHASRIDLVESGNSETRQVLRAKNCIVCKESGGEKIGRCEGLIGKNIPCSNRCHLTCAKKYNASGITMDYAAEIFAQNKFLCPLHACSSCNEDGNKRDAYAGEMITCRTCLKAYHQQCIPAGAMITEVLVKAGNHTELVKMMQCPEHAPTANYRGNHLEVCEGCGERDQLRNCSSCPQSFHWDSSTRNCRSVKTVDGMQIRDDLCSHCAAKRTIRIDSLVLFYNHGRLAIARFVKNSDTFGKAWIQMERGGKMEKNVNELVNMNKHYSKLGSEKQSEEWEKMYQAACNDKKKMLLELKPNVEFKMKQRMVRQNASIKFETKTFRMLAFCEAYEQEKRECPPRCSLREACKNRQISTGYIHPDMKLVHCGEKGLGVVATSPILEHQFLGEFIGELINTDRMETIKRNIEISGDKQFCHYFMEIKQDVFVDAANYGNITRFLNHSCDPNAEVQVMWKMNNGTEGEKRIVIRAKRAIEVGEEITIDYQWDSLEHNCLCGATNCIRNKCIATKSS